jgi:hypothetical protein
MSFFGAGSLPSVVRVTAEARFWRPAKWFDASPSVIVARVAWISHSDIQP